MAILTVMSAYMSLPVCEPFSMWVLSTENSSLLIDAEMSTLALWRKYCNTVITVEDSTQSHRKKKMHATNLYHILYVLSQTYIA